MGEREAEDGFDQIAICRIACNPPRERFFVGEVDVAVAIHDRSEGLERGRIEREALEDAGESLGDAGERVVVVERQQLDEEILSMAELVGREDVIDGGDEVILREREAFGAPWVLALEVAMEQTEDLFAERAALFDLARCVERWFVTPELREERQREDRQAWLDHRLIGGCAHAFLHRIRVA